MVIALLASITSCASQTPSAAPAPAAPAALPPPPVGTMRLPGTAACETEIGCMACATDQERDLVRVSFLVHLTEIHACYDQAAKTHPGTEGRVVFRLGIDPTGTVGTSCVVRSAVNDPNIESCVSDLLLSWKFPKPSNGGWALVDAPFVFGKK